MPSDTRRPLAAASIPAVPLGAEPVRRPFGIKGFLRRNMLLVAGCAALVVPATAYFTAKLPPVYAASASLRIDEPQTRIHSTDLVRSTAGGLRHASRNDVATEIDMLKSRAFAGLVVDSLALQLSLGHPTRTSRDALFSTIVVSRSAIPQSYLLTREGNEFVLRHVGSSLELGRVRPDVPFLKDGIQFQLAPLALEHESIEFQVRSFEEVVDRLRRQLRISRRSRESNFVDVYAESQDPTLAAAISNVLALSFIQERQETQRLDSRSTAKFLSEQITKLSEQLRAAEDTLRSFRQNEQVVNLPDQARTGLGLAADLQAQRDALDAERLALANLVRGASERGGDQGATPQYRSLAAFPTLLRNQAVSNLLSSLLAVEDRRVELLARRSINDPDVELLTERARELETQLRAFSQAYLQGLSDQVRALDATLSRSHSQLARLPAKEVHYARLQRDVHGLEEIVLALQARLKEVEITEAAEDATIQLIDVAVVPQQPARPNLLLNLVFATLAGLALGFTAAGIREHADRSVRTRGEITSTTGMPVLGLVPSFARARVKESSRHRGFFRRRDSILLPTRAASNDGKLAQRPRHLFRGVNEKPVPFQVVDAYQRLQTNLAFLPGADDIRVLQVTSALPGEGKTTSAINLSLVRAKIGQKVLLIDTDLRRSRIHEALRLVRRPGLSDVLDGSADIRDAIQLIRFGQDSILHVIAAGSAAEHPDDLLLGAEFGSLLQGLRSQFTTIILDSSPVNAAAEAAVISTLADGVVIVARSGITTHESLTYCMEQLQSVRAPVVGVILNDVDFSRDGTYDESYRYYGSSSVYA